MIFVHNDSGVLSVQKLSEKPKIADYDVLIEVCAAGVNRPDVLQRKGLYAPPKGVTPVLGLEVSGVIIEIGRCVSSFSVGDKVMALVNGGGYSRFCKVAQGSILPLPSEWSFYEGATFPEVFFTLWKNLINIAQLKSDDYFLVHAGASGIGAGAIQFAKHLGVKTLTTVSSKEKASFCSTLNVDFVINYHTQDFVEEILSYTQKKGVNVILDMVGGDYLQRNIRIAAKNACIVNIASLQKKISDISIFHLMQKNIKLTGSTLRSASDEEKGYICRAIYKKLWSSMKNRSIVPIIDSIFSIYDVDKAHSYMESNKHMGKIVLDLNGA